MQSNFVLLYTYVNDTLQNESLWVGRSKSLAYNEHIRGLEL